MTSYVIVPHQSLYKVSADVPSHIRALAEPLACVLRAQRKARFDPGASVFVIPGRAQSKHTLVGHQHLDRPAVSRKPKTAGLGEQPMVGQYHRRGGTYGAIQPVMRLVMAQQFDKR